MGPKDDETEECIRDLNEEDDNDDNDDDDFFHNLNYDYFNICSF